MRATPLLLLTGWFLTIATAASAQDRIPWMTSLDQARHMAAQQQRVVLLHFYGDNCPPCRLLERRVFNQPEVIRSINAGYVPVKINVGEQQRLARHYHIDKIPTDIFVGPDGKELYRELSQQDPIAYKMRLDSIAAHVRLSQQPPVHHFAQAPQQPQADVIEQATRPGSAMADPNRPPDWAQRSGYTMQQNPYSQPFNQAPPAQAPLAPEAPLPGDYQAAPQRQAHVAPELNHNPHFHEAPVVQPPQAYEAPVVGQPPIYRDQQPLTDQQSSIYREGQSSIYGNYDRQPVISQPEPPIASQPGAAGPSDLARGSRYGASDNWWEEESPATAPPAAPYGDPPQMPQQAPPQQSSVTAAPRLDADFGRPTNDSFAPQQEMAQGHIQLPVQSAPPRPPAVVTPQAQNVAPQPAIALDGFCPVTLVNEWQWKKGDERWGVVHKNRTYLLGGWAEQQLFLSNPDKYSPMLAGHDAVIFAERGQWVEGKREHGALLGEQVFLFADNASLEKFEGAPERYLHQVQQALRSSGQGMLR